VLPAVREVLSRVSASALTQALEGITEGPNVSSGGPDVTEPGAGVSAPGVPVDARMPLTSMHAATW